MRVPSPHNAVKMLSDVEAEEIHTICLEYEIREAQLIPDNVRELVDGGEW